MGLLTVTGTLELDQLWPAGSSDADTMRVKLATNDPFRFQSQPGDSPSATAAFEGAYVHVKGRKEPVIVQHSRSLRVRLQGIDAPELHYRPVASVPELRQHFAEAPITALAQHLRNTFGDRPTLACEAVTQVAAPDDVFDMYARFIGDIVVTEAGARLNLNQWLVAEGWAFPSFYNSMTPDEICALTVRTRQAHYRKLNLWSHSAYTTLIGDLDRTLTYRKPGSAIQEDHGPVILPKLFRRLYQWQIAVSKGSTTATSLRDYLLANSPSKREKIIRTKDFIVLGDAVPKIDLGDAIRANGRLKYRPEDIVFTEEPSTLFAANGQRVEAW